MSFVRYENRQSRDEWVWRKEMIAHWVTSNAWETNSFKVTWESSDWRSWWEVCNFSENDPRKCSVFIPENSWGKIWCVKVKGRREEAIAKKIALRLNSAK